MSPVRRILLLITDLQIGGTPTVVRELATRLREPGRVAIDVACLAGWGPVADELQQSEVKVTALDARSPLDFHRTLFRLVRLIRGGGFDTVFSFLIHANATAALASAFFPGVRFLQSIQTTQPNPRWHWRLQRLIQPAADRMVVPSESAAQVATDWAGVPRERIAVIPNAVDVASFDAIYAANAAQPRTPSSSSALAVAELELGVPKGTNRGRLFSPKRIGFIGRLDPVKRVPDLVAAMPRLLDCRLDIYGEGPDRHRIEATVDRLRLHDRVTLHGAIARPHEALATMDVLVLPSQAEGFGLVLIEAMAAGVPVVGTNVPGIRDVITKFQTGLLVDLTDEFWLFMAIRCATNHILSKRLIHKARAEVETRFAWPAVLNQYRRLLAIET